MRITLCKGISLFALFDESLRSGRIRLFVVTYRFFTFPLLCCSPKQEIIVFALCFQAILDTEQHSISYTLSRTQAVIVEYMPDEDTDMFQVRFPSQIMIHQPLDIRIACLAETR